MSGKRVLITHADAFMGPALCAVFGDHGATVVADTSPLRDPDEPLRAVSAAGLVDVLVINLAHAAPSTSLLDVSEEEWITVFRALVEPMPRLVRAVLPQMMARRSGKILVMGSAAALRGMRRASTYSAARGAQLAFVQAAGVELAAHNIQINAIAQNFVENPTYFLVEVQADTRFQAASEARSTPRASGRGARRCRVCGLLVQRLGELLCRASIPDVWRLGSAIETSRSIPQAKAPALN